MKTNDTRLAHAEATLIKLIAKHERAVAKMNAYRDEYQSLRDTFSAEEDTAHRRYRLWQTKALAAEYGVRQVKETIRCINAGLI